MLPDDEATGTGPRRVLFCHGKLFWELREERARRKLEDRVAIVRLEQVYPFPADLLKEQLEVHGAAGPDGDVVWVQEEPENMGAWRFVHIAYERLLGTPLRYVARAESPSPASGSLTTHQAEQGDLLSRAFEGLEGE